MTDHDAEIATLDQEATQLRARVKRLEAALRVIADRGSEARAKLDGITSGTTRMPDWYGQLRSDEQTGWLAADALQESSE